MRIIFWSRELIKSALWLERSLCLPLHRTSMFFLVNKVEVKVAMWDCGRAWHEKVRSSVGAWRRHRPHSSTLAWTIPWTEEPSRLQSMGSRGVRHDWATSLSLFTFMKSEEKEMATHSSVLAWRIPGTGEPGWLPSMGSHRVRHNWSNLAAAAEPSRRKKDGAGVQRGHSRRSFES